jgi:hypothetical protein
MKKLFFLLLAAAALNTSIAQPPAGTADKGNVYGEKFEPTGAIDVNQIETVVKEGNAAVNVKVTGTVSEVCTKEGCWIRVKTNKGNLFVKMKDHKFLVPLDLNGKQIVINGTGQMKVTSVKELKHFAEDAGKTQEEIDAIKEPKKEITLQAAGIIVL